MDRAFKVFSKVILNSILCYWIKVDGRPSVIVQHFLTGGNFASKISKRGLLETPFIAAVSDKKKTFQS